MRHLGLGLMACLLLVGTSVAQDGFEHREFTNQEGIYLSYDINNVGFIKNGELILTNDVVLTFMGSTGEPLEYESSLRTAGILQFKPYDNTYFDLDVREGDYVVATYRFEGNFYSSDSPNYMNGTRMGGPYDGQYPCQTDESGRCIPGTEVYPGQEPVEPAPVVTPTPAPNPAPTPVVQPEPEPEHHPTPNKDCDGLRTALGIAQGQLRDWEEANADYGTFGNHAQNQADLDALREAVRQAAQALAECEGN